MKNIVIIGADGFIGSHLSQYLVEKGIHVWGNILPNSPYRKRIDSLPGMHIVECGISDLCKRADLFVQEPDAVFYLAWQGVDANARNNFFLQYQNINMGCEVVRFVAQLRAKRLIFPGSTSEYLFNDSAINENAIPSASNAYGSVKIAMRFLLRALSKELGVPFVYAVLTGVYAQDRRDNNVIYYVIDALLHGQSPALTKLEQKWDYIHIDDAVKALSILGEKGKDGEVYPIGCGENRPLREYIELIHSYINPRICLGIGEKPYPGGQLPSSCIDLRAMRALGFKPEISFNEGIVQVIESMRKEISE